MKSVPFFPMTMLNFRLLPDSSPLLLSFGGECFVLKQETKLGDLADTGSVLLLDKDEEISPTPEVSCPSTHPPPQKLGDFHYGKGSTNRNFLLLPLKVFSKQSSKVGQEASLMSRSPLTAAASI